MDLFRQVQSFSCPYFIYKTRVSDEKIKKDGVIVEALPDTKFKVRLEDGREILAYLSGKMRMHYIKVTIGDTVTMEMSPDETKGRIVYRK